MRFPIDPARPFGLPPAFVAGAIWTATFALLVGLWLAGHVPSISYGVYAAAGQRWLEGKPLYDTTNIEGFQYFPQSAMLLAPLSALGSPAGDILWRALAWIVLATGTLRLTKQLAPQRWGEGFFIATCVSIGPTIGPLGNGQANLLLAGLTLHVAADVAAKHWWRATVVMALGIALKPLIAVLVLLVWALYRPMRWRVPLALLVVFVTPWLVRDHAYVLAQYADCLTKLEIGARPGPDYEDIRGLLATLGWVMPHDVATVVRLLAALGVLGLCFRARKCLRESYAAVLVAAFAVAYLMLFNPRTQSTSYAMPGAVIAVLAALYLIEERRRAFFVMLAIQTAFTLNYHWLPFIELWLKPLACVVFFAFLLHEVVKPPELQHSSQRKVER